MDQKSESVKQERSSRDFISSFVFDSDVTTRWFLFEVYLQALNFDQKQVLNSECFFLNAVCSLSQWMQ